MHHGFKGAQVLGSEVTQNFVKYKSGPKLLKFVIPCPNQMQILFLAETHKHIIICNFQGIKSINFMFFYNKNNVADDFH